MAESERSQVKLTPKQLAAVEALMLAPSIQEAAARAGVPESTLRRWRAQPDFQAALKAASYELWQGLTPPPGQHRESRRHAGEHL